ncbi:MAG: ankyrin repeat domain-containing protein, partial [Alphaproteobacteria bacterium]|nr:ankyrin repeat domain-containing protein [Alphaproteobacteria bacterium]
MTFFNILPNKVLIKNTITSILTTILYSVCTKLAKKMKSKLNNLFFYIGKTFNNYDMLLTCMKTELSQRRYDTAKKIIASLKKIDSSRLDDFMEEFFYTSVMEDDVQNLDFLIETGYTCSYTGSYTGDTYSYGYIEDTPTLIWAIQNKRTKCAKKLFEAGFDVNELDENYCTAFLWAVKEESLSLVKTFIEKADINTQDSFGNTPLLSAVQNKNEQITKLLIKKKANQYFVFSKLIEQKDISLIKWFVEKGADINTQNKDGNFAETRFNWWVEQQNKDGKSALHLAVKKNDMKLVKFFIESGADIAIQDEQGHTA